MTDNEQELPELDSLAALDQLRRDYEALLQNPIYASMRVSLHRDLEALGYRGDERDISDRESAIIVGEKIAIRKVLGLDFYTYSAMEAEIKQRRYEELSRQNDDE